MNYKSPRFLFTIIGIVLVLVLIFVGYKWYVFQNTASTLPDGAVVFVENGVAQRYVIEDYALVPEVIEPRTDGITILESVPSPLNSEEKIVLAQIPELQGTAAALLAADGTLTLMVTGNTNKADLVVRDDGLVVFSTTPALLVEEVTTPSVEDPENETPEEEEVTGTADAPTEPMEIVEISNDPELMTFDLRAWRITSLGAGYSPRILGNGSVIALTSDGVVRIDPVTRVRTLLLPYSIESVERGRISPSGQIVALPGANTSLEFYRVAQEPTAPSTYLGFLERESGRMNVAFVDDERVFVRTGQSVARYYQVPTEEIPIARPIAIVSVTQ